MTDPNSPSAPQARPPERSEPAKRRASDGDGGSGGAKPPGLVKLVSQAELPPDIPQDLGQLALIHEMPAIFELEIAAL